MRSVLLLAAVVVSLAAGCSGTSGDRPSAAASPTPIPLINVDDMMGLYPQQTMFVATPDHVVAVTLLNHFTRYRIATNGVAQVSVDSTGRSLFLLDADAAGLHRLRAFDVATGSERAALAGIDSITGDRHVLATASNGRVLVLKSDTRHAWIDAYDGVAFRPLGMLTDSPGCGDRLLASSSGVAIVCLATGDIAFDDLRGRHSTINGALRNLVAASMADDGTLYVATADRQLATVAAGATTVVSLPWPSEWSGTVLADGLAVAQGGEAVIIAERTDDGAWLRVFEANNMTQRKSFRLAGVPRGGILSMWPFAYYTVDSTVRHVDLNNGLLETMTEVGPDAVPGAVVNGL
jgi:hypothetical protein